MTAVKWTNAVSGDLSDQADWSNNAVPRCRSDLTIGVACAYDVPVDSPESVHSIALSDASGMLEVAPKLALTATLAVESGTHGLNPSMANTADMPAAQQRLGNSIELYFSNQTTTWINHAPTVIR